MITLPSLKNASPFVYLSICLSTYLFFSLPSRLLSLPLCLYSLSLHSSFSLLFALSFSSSLCPSPFSQHPPIPPLSVPTPHFPSLSPFSSFSFPTSPPSLPPPSPSLQQPASATYKLTASFSGSFHSLTSIRQTRHRSEVSSAFHVSGAGGGIRNMKFVRPGKFVLLMTCCSCHVRVVYCTSKTHFTGIYARAPTRNS